MSNKIKVSKENRQEMLSEIKAYFLKERDEELGDLAAGFILDFVIEKIAPHFYNQGVWDSHRYLQEKIEDLLGIQK